RASWPPGPLSKRVGGLRRPVTSRACRGRRTKAVNEPRSASPPTRLPSSTNGGGVWPTAWSKKPDPRDGGEEQVAEQLVEQVEHESPGPRVYDVFRAVRASSLSVPPAAPATGRLRGQVTHPLQQGLQPRRVVGDALPDPLLAVGPLLVLVHPLGV